MFEYKSVQETAAIQNSNAKLGLTEAEAAGRLKKNGGNRLREPPKRTIPEALSS